MGRNISRTQEEYNKELNIVHNGNIIPLGDYIKANISIMHRCLIHNYDFMARPSKLLNGQGCKYCGKEKLKEKMRLSIDEYKTKLFNKYGNEFELVGKYTVGNEKSLFLHNIENANSHTFYSTPNALLHSGGCGVCNGLQVCVGYNDIHTTNPKLGLLLLNYNDGYNYTKCSGRFVNWKCPDCGNIIHKKISEVSNRGLICSNCSDGLSYPNKFIYNLLNQVKESLDSLQREYSPKWCEFIIDDIIKHGRYDVYFEINNKKYVIEMDGGLGHGNRSFGDEDQNTNMIIDKQKDALAIKHDIVPIRINSNYESMDRFEFLKNNIIDSTLKEIIDFNLVDFNKADLESQNSLFKICYTLWNNDYSINKICDELDLSDVTIRKYLNRADKMGLCDYVNKRRIDNSIICVTTNKVFLSATEAAKYYNITLSNIIKCCKGIGNYCGWFNNEKLKWMYYSEYLNIKKNELSN